MCYAREMNKSEEKINWKELQNNLMSEKTEVESQFIFAKYEFLIDALNLWNVKELKKT